MDNELRKAQRDFVSGNITSQMLIGIRHRFGLCAVCSKRILNDKECTCIGLYIYEDKNNKFRLTRDKRSTLPHGIITGVKNKERVFSIMSLVGGKNLIKFKDVVDMNYMLLRGIYATDGEKKFLGSLLDSLEVRAGEWDDTAGRWKNDRYVGVLYENRLRDAGGP